MAGPEPLDARLRDQDALDEIEMTSNLMIAASESDAPLTGEQIDTILGVEDKPRTDPPEGSEAVHRRLERNGA